MRYLVVVLLMVIPHIAIAQDKSFTCKEIRAGIIMFGGAANAEKVARSMGISEDKIEKAKRCLAKHRPLVKR
jgi:hypothetical protein